MEQPQAQLPPTARIADVGRAAAAAAVLLPPPKLLEGGRRAPRESLPTRVERRHLRELGTVRGRSTACVRSLSFTLRVNALVGAPEWGYVAHVQAKKGALGKRAVGRSVARRRVKAAVRRVLPAHAARAHEYLFILHAEALATPHDALIDEVAAALRAADAYHEALPYALCRRRRHPPPTPRVAET